MRPSFVVSLVLLLLFLTKAQGIRLEKGSLVAVQRQKQHDEESTLLKRSNNDADHEEAILCKDDQCTGKIRNRKLVTTSISTTHTISKNVKNTGNEAHPMVNGDTRNVKVNDHEEKEIKVNILATSKQRQLHHENEHYSDLVDIAEMDYSPARRKPPIHN